MINKIHIIFFLFISIIFFAACKNEDIAPMDMGYEYFPSNPGHWVVYDIDSTFYDDFNDTIINYHYQIKELVESTFLDNQNRITQRIERYKSTDSVNWHLVEVWSSNITSSTAEKIEENVRFVKLIFPIVDGKSWNGNAFNSLNGSNYPDYEYDNIYDSYIVNGSNFDSTVKVIQNYENNAIQQYDQFEVYAKNIGLIYKKYKMININFNSEQSTPTYQGVDYTYKIVSYGTD
jgi:hypothetical protein